MKASSLTSKEKFEAIGYLSIPGVIKAIEPTVPVGKKDSFRKKYKGKCSSEYPYEANKYGNQFRIYLNDVDNCPSGINKLLDNQYGNRINDTSFIKELVEQFGFSFKRGKQNYGKIRNSIFSNNGRKEQKWFENGLHTNRKFVISLIDAVEKGKSIPQPNIIKYKEQIKNIGKRKTNGNDDSVADSFTSKQRLIFGWTGEEYISRLLDEKNPELLSEIGLSDTIDYKVDWYNKGFTKDDWENGDDKSVGKGCDILITLDSGEELFLEVKSSRRSYPYITMTSSEMKKMEEEGDKYILIKVNALARLLRGESPDLITIINPYEELFHTKNMKEATFIVAGEKK